MPADWNIEFWPQCSRYVFLSHCEEDRRRLVGPVHDALETRGCNTWIDERHYPVGRDAFETLRDKILECRHVVYFVTSSFLGQGRGWTGIERAYSALLHQNLRYGPSEISHVELPLFFLPPNHVQLARSAWGSVVGTGRGAFYRPGRVDGGAVDWAIHEILRFIRQEEQYSAEIADRIDRDSRLREHVTSDLNLRDRILAMSPPPLPLSR